MQYPEPDVAVSVLVFTYNHAAHISQALDSVLAQDTPFQFEIIVSEDASTDGTREIVERYAAAWPGLIRPIFSKRNVRSNEVVARAIRAARGKYVALLDGDDFWTNPGKLRAQVAFLERHTECSMCFHNAVVVREGHVSSDLWTRPGQKAVSTLEDIWRGNFAATCTVMIRREAVADIGDWYYKYFPVTDWPLYIYAAERGPIGYMDEAFGAYRLHSGGLYSGLPEARKLDSIHAFYRRMKEDRGAAGRHLAEAGHSLFFFEWAEEYERRGNLDVARLCLRRSVLAGGIGRAVGWRRALRKAAALWRPRFSAGRSGSARS